MCRGGLLQERVEVDLVVPPLVKMGSDIGEYEKQQNNQEPRDGQSPAQKTAQDELNARIVTGGLDGLFDNRRRYGTHIVSPGECGDRA
jgi:hypothetical protein